MMKFTGLFFAIQLFSGLLFSHGYPIHHVPIQIDVYPGHIRAQFTFHYSYFHGAVLGESNPIIPARDWRSEWYDRSDKYIKNHFSLAIDGVPLEGKRVDAFYRQEPYDQETGRFEFIYYYPAPESGETLSGNVIFHKDVFDQEKDQEAPFESGMAEEFYSLVNFSGSSRQRLNIPVAEPNFEVPLKSVQITSGEIFLDKFRQGMVDPFGRLPLSLFALTFILFSIPKKSKWLTAVASLILFSIGNWLPLESLLAHPAWPWGLMVLVTAAVAIPFPPRVGIGAFAVSSLFWGIIWQRTIGLAGLPGSYLNAAHIGYWLGGLITMMACGGLGTLVLQTHFKLLKRKSESAAPDLFNYHCRRAAAVFLILCLFRLVQILIPRGGA